MSKPTSRIILKCLNQYKYCSNPKSNPLSHLISQNPRPNLPNFDPLGQRSHFSSSPISRLFVNPGKNVGFCQRLHFSTNPVKNVESWQRSHFSTNPVSRIARNPSKNVDSCQRSHFSTNPVSKMVQNPSKNVGFCQRLQFSTRIVPNPNKVGKFDKKLLGFRYVATRGLKLGSGEGLRNVVREPGKAVKSAFSRYKEAVGLQIEAFWKRNSLVLVGGAGVIVCILLWRVMFGIANTFVGLSEGMAKYGFLALSSAIVAFAGLYLRSRFTINPDKVYRMAMRRLNTSAGILEVMGAPLTGTDLRAYVMSGGGITLKNFKAGLRSKRCFLIFPIRGSERKGLVSVEVKNKKGQYDMKLLAVDIPMATGPDQRIFLIGDEEEYLVGGGLISELRDPVVRAMAATKEFEDLDIQEDKEDAERELEEAERRHREELEKLEKDS